RRYSTMTKSTSTRFIGANAPNEQTRRRRDVSDLISDFVRDYGEAPSDEEISEDLGPKSSKMAARLVREPQARGAVACRLNEPPSTVPTGHNAITVALPEQLARAVRVIAERARTTPEAVVAEAVHERLSGICESLEETASSRGGK